MTPPDEIKRKNKAILCDMVHVDNKINARYENKNANSLGRFILRWAIMLALLQCKNKISVIQIH